MVSFQDWCEHQDEQVAEHDLKVFRVLPEKLNDAYTNVAAAVRTHYMSPERIANQLEKLGKQKAASALRSRMPETARGRSGDLGEILATEFVDEEMSYRAAIKRLRWKQRRDMPMLGEDVIGIRQSEDEPIKFLKGEAKSWQALSNKPITQARDALDDNFGLPSSDALNFVVEHLIGMGQKDLADAIEIAQWETGILPEQVEHLLFTFSQNDPQTVLQNNLNTYAGDIHQNYIGLSIADHQGFIKKIYEIAAHGDDN